MGDGDKMKDVILAESFGLNTAKNLACDGQMLHSFDLVRLRSPQVAQDRFIQHDNQKAASV